MRIQKNPRGGFKPYTVLARLLAFFWSSHSKRKQAAYTFMYIQNPGLRQGMSARDVDPWAETEQIYCWQTS